jgi:3-carboxy-cis,cis-muconate cycloisomerase
MASTVIDSELYAGAFGDDRMRAIFCDEAYVARLLEVEAALAAAEAEAGLIPREAAEEIGRQARAEQFTLAELRRGLDATAHSLVPLVRALAARCGGEAGRYVHWGATTQDIIDTANALRLRDAFAFVTGHLEDLLRLLVRRAAEEADTLMAGRTHGQHALPVTLGYKLAVWVWEVRRQLDRWAQAAPRVLVGNITGAVGTFAGFGGAGPRVERLALGRLGLGTPEICWHTARDRPAEVAALLTLTAGTLEKIAGEVYRLQSTEYGEVEEPFFAGKVGSSTMPHKRNPSLCEAVITSCRAARAEASMVFEAMAQEHERHSALWKTEWVALPNAFIFLGGALAKCCRIIAGLQVRREAMAENLERSRGAVMSEAVMLALGRFVGRGEAHDIVYEAGMRAFEQRRHLRACLEERPEVTAHLSAADLDRLFDYRRYTGAAVQLAREAGAAVAAGGRTGAAAADPGRRD